MQSTGNAILITGGGSGTGHAPRRGLSQARKHGHHRWPQERHSGQNDQCEPRTDPEFKRKTSGTARDTVTNNRPAWVVRDENYVSARWPGDTHSLPAHSPQ